MFKLRSFIEHFTKAKEVQKFEKPVYGFYRPKQVIQDGVVTTILEEVVSDEKDVRLHHVVSDYALANMLAAGVQLSPTVLNGNRLSEASSVNSQAEKIQDYVKVKNEEN